MYSNVTNTRVNQIEGKKKKKKCRNRKRKQTVARATNPNPRHSQRKGAIIVATRSQEEEEAIISVDKSASRQRDPYPLFQYRIGERVRNDYTLHVFRG